MSDYICITDWSNIDTIIKNNIWAAKDKHLNQISECEIGDRLIFFIKSGRYKGEKKPTSVYGIYEVSSDLFRDESKIFSGDETYPNRIKIKKIVDVEKIKRFKPLIPKLKFIRNKEYWGPTFMGRSMIKINKNDFEIIKNYLTDNKI